MIFTFAAQYMNFGSRFRALPYILDAETGRVTVNQNKWDIISWNFVLCSVWLRAVFLIVQLIGFVSYGESDSSISIGEFVLLFFFLLLTIISSFSFPMVLRRRFEISDYFNLFVELQRQLEEGTIRK